MPVFLVGYDLRHGTEDEYRELIETIKKISASWWHCLDSTWLIVHQGPHPRSGMRSDHTSSCPTTRGGATSCWSPGWTRARLGPPPSMTIVEAGCGNTSEQSASGPERATLDRPGPIRPPH